MLLVGAGGVQGHVGGHLVGSDQLLCQHVGLHFLAADVRQHDPVDLHARGEGLSAALFHLKAERRILDDILLRVGQGILRHDGAYSLAPSAGGLQIGCDFEL